MHALAPALGRITASFSRAENYAFTAQIRRAAASIPSNLVEGCGRGGDAKSAPFCCVARGSASELEYHLLLSRDLNLIQPGGYEKLEPRVTEIKRILTLFEQKLRAESARLPLISDIWLRPRAALGGIGCLTAAAFADTTSCLRSHRLPIWGIW